MGTMAVAWGLLTLAMAPASLATPLFGHAFVAPDVVPAELKTADGRAITVLDTREEKVWKRAHLPGAVHIDWSDFRRGWLREGRLPTDLKALAADLAKLGVDGGRPVLVCGAAAQGWGEEGRIAWMLRYLGHRDVAVLDGGCEAWARAGRLMVTGAPAVVRGHFEPKVQSGLRAELPAVAALVAHPSAKGAQVIDVRTQEEYDGATPYYAARGGHVPGAKHVYWKALVDPKTGRVKDKAAVRAALAAAGIDPDRPVITYCTGGVRSAHAALVLREAGVDAANFDGSWWEYAGDDALPVEK